MSTFRKFLLAHRIAVGVFVLALVGVGAFGLRFGAEAVYFRDPAHREQTLEAWMTPRYVGMSWGLRKEVIGQLMQLDPDNPRDGKPPTLDQVAANMGITLDELQTLVETAKAQAEADRDRGPRQ